MPEIVVLKTVKKRGGRRIRRGGSQMGGALPSIVDKDAFVQSARNFIASHPAKSESGFRGFLSKANRILKGTKLISNVAGSLASAGVPYAAPIAAAAGALGYGRRKRRRGGNQMSVQGGRRRPTRH